MESHARWKERQEAQATMMAHYECDHCDMQATVVRTVAASVEWLRHMESHNDAFGYRVWQWTVVPLTFDQDASRELPGVSDSGAPTS